MIKTTSKQSYKSEYPRLKIAGDGVIVMFRNKTSGMVVHVPEDWTINSVGEYAADWDLDSFKPYYGIVTIES